MMAEENTIGMSLDSIFHPGVTLAEILENKGMSQRELAVRTGVSEKHISTVIHGQKPISPAFARKLEYALGIGAYYWLTLQANYDRQMLDYQELHNITEDELSVLNCLKEVTADWQACGWISQDESQAGLVMNYRKSFGISNLLDTPNMPQTAVYRVQNKGNNIDPYVMFAWQVTCERLTGNMTVADEVDKEKIRTKIPDIKQVMFARTNQIEKKLTTILAECGIAFKVVPYFTGAPVQGFIKKTTSDALILCVTLRQKFADIFWFTLFHEIAHILNGDIDNLANEVRRGIVDFDTSDSDVEIQANSAARDILINPNDYIEFVKARKYRQASNIKLFAESQKVKEYIVKGRLMKDGLIPWGNRPKYDWV